MIAPSRPLTNGGTVAVRRLTRCPLIACAFNFAKHSRLSATFGHTKLAPHVIFATASTSIVGACIQLKLKMKIVTDVTISPITSPSLIHISTRSVFDRDAAGVNFHHDAFLHDCVCSFVRHFTPRLAHSIISTTITLHSGRRVRIVFGSVGLPRGWFLTLFSTPFV